MALLQATLFLQLAPDFEIKRRMLISFHLLIQLPPTIMKAWLTQISKYIEATYYADIVLELFEDTTILLDIRLLLLSVGVKLFDNLNHPSLCKLQEKLKGHDLSTIQEFIPEVVPLKEDPNGNTLSLPIEKIITRTFRIEDEFEDESIEGDVNEGTSLQNELQEVKSNKM